MFDILICISIINNNKRQYSNSEFLCFFLFHFINNIDAIIYNKYCEVLIK